MLFCGGGDLSRAKKSNYLDFSEDRMFGLTLANTNFLNFAVLFVRNFKKGNGNINRFPKRSRCESLQIPVSLVR